MIVRTVSTGNPVNTGNNAPAGQSIDELWIMTFSVIGIRMGVDVGQVSRMLEPGQAEVEELQVVAIHERLSFRDRNVSYRSPRILLLRDRGTVGVMIDQPEDIIAVKLDHIRPLPPVFGAGMKTTIVWGVALIEEEIVLLVDLFQLVAACNFSQGERRE